MQIEKMKAAILVESGQPLVIDEVRLPEHLEVGQVLVKVLYSGICGSQLGEIDAIKGPDGYLPHLLGHEGTGLVLETGPGVSQVDVGQHVVLHWRPGPGIQAQPPLYQWRGQNLNAGWLTTFNEYAIVSENRCTSIPASTPLDQAALLGCAVTTAFGALSRELNIKPGESLVILGVGGVGQAMVQAARLMGAYPIVAVDLFDSKLKLATQLGADYVFSGHQPDLEAVLRQVCGASGAEHIIDNTGRSKLIEMAYRLSAKNGKILLVGVPAPQDKVSLDTLPIHFGKSLMGSHGGRALPAEDIPRYLRLQEAGRLDFGPLISEVIELDQINQALDNLRLGKIASRSLIRMYS